MDHLFNDPWDASKLWLGGVYNERAGVMSFEREAGNALTFVRFEWMTELNGHVNAFDADGYTMFFCGTLIDPRDRREGRLDDPKAQLVRMELDGQVTWYKNFEKTRRRADDFGASMCRGLAFQENTQILAATLEFETVEESAAYDVYVILFDTDGLYLDGQIVLRKNFFSSNPALASYGAIGHPDNLSFFFVGSSPGYSTSFREIGDAVNDSFIFNVDFERGSSCLATEEISRAQSSDMTASFTVDDKEIAESEVFSSIDAAQVIPGAQSSTVTVRPALDLVAQPFGDFLIPKPCSLKSERLSNILYYIGESELTYKIADENRDLDGSTIGTLSKKSELVCLNGDPTSSFAYYDDRQKAIQVLESDSPAHCSRAVLRECTKNSELIELFIDIQMIVNALPEFATDPDPVYNIAVENSPTSFTLPSIVDKQRQDYWTVLIEQITDTEEAFFPFVTYSKQSNSLLFEPVVWNRG